MRKDRIFILFAIGISCLSFVLLIHGFSGEWFPVPSSSAGAIEVIIINTIGYLTYIVPALCAIIIALMLLRK